MSDQFQIGSDPDLFKAREWAADIAKVRVIETSVGPYGAIDLKAGTLYFDVGDTLVKIPEHNTIIVKTHKGGS